MSQQAQSRLGFIGTGLLGSAMVRRLLDLGYQVTVWNRARERLAPLIEAGAIEAPSPRAVTEASDIVMLCVLNTPAVSECVWGENGVAAATGRGRLVIDFSTIDPEVTRDVASRLTEASGTDWLDAPVSGGPAVALKGELAIMVGGTPSAYARGKALLAQLGANVTHMGPPGAGQSAKIINQAIVGTGFVMMAEALTLARAAGIDAARMPACLAGGYADSPLLQIIYPRMVNAAFDPPAGFARQLLKDMKAVQEFAEGFGVTLPLVDTATDRYDVYVGQGNDMAESASIIRLYESETRK